jgi:uncharacterized protein (TIGR02600 family)
MKPLHSQPAQRGIALVIVLAFLVLIAGLMIAFFSNVSTEFSSARSFADGVTTKQLADSAVNVVMGQIREATALEGGAWGSQPGMIRVYGSGGTTPGAALTPSDKLHSLYKLYSSEQLLVSGPDLEKRENVTENFANWWKQPAAFTDLNQPVKLTLQNPGAPNRTSYRYPIMDPYFSKYLATNGKDAAGAARSGSDFVEGFDLTADGTDDRALEQEEKIARMPARWIYVLRDGTLTTGTANGARISWEGTAAVSQRPSAENPIVGRIAYWTDDETSKVNINTAGGFSMRNIPSGYDERSYAGSFWDTPRTRARFETGGAWDQFAGRYSARDGGLAISQPLNGEVQRYPGHPATTSLGLIFGSSLTSEQIYQLTPRLLGGGSMGGTAEMPSKTWEGGAGIPRAFDKTFKKDRLYASVDELLFSATAGANQERATNAGGLTPDLLEKTRFFLTAHSRAPELNLQGRPRLSLWPVRWDNPSERDSESYRTAADKALAFCATLGAKDGSRDWSRRFYFQRFDPYSTTHDANIPRNAKLHTYLQDLTSTGIPGFGTRSFAEKFGTDRDQILTEMFDQIRTINLRDGTELKDRNLSVPPLSAAKIVEREKIQFAPRGLVVPTKRANAVGFGRFPTISEVSIVLYHAGYEIDDGTGPRFSLKYTDKFKPIYGPPPPPTEPPTPRPLIGVTPNNVLANYVRAFLVFEMFHPQQGYSTLIGPNASSTTSTQAIEIEVEGMNDFALGETNLGFPSGAKTLSFTGAGWGLGATQGFTSMMPGYHSPTDPPPVPPPSRFGRYYPFQSSAASAVRIPNSPVPGTAQIVNFKGAKLNVRVLFRGQNVQNYTLDFPNTTLPVPTDAVWISSGNLPDPAGFYPGEWAANAAQWACGTQGDLTGAVKSLAGRMLAEPISNPRFGAFSAFSSGPTRYPGEPPLPSNYNNANRARQILQPGDTVRSLVLFNTPRGGNDGDLRIGAVTDGSSKFSAHPDYLDPAVRHAHNLRPAADGWNFPSNMYFSGQSWGFYGPDDTFPSTKPFGLKLKPAPNTPTDPQPCKSKYPLGRLVKGANGPNPNVNTLPVNLQPDLLPQVDGVLRSDGQPGDFDTGLGAWADGPFVGKTDDGIVAIPSYNNYYGTWGFTQPYFGGGNEDVPHDSFFSPNRQVSSAVVFGSLPAGRNKHWETLCFSPNPAGTNHPGNVAPKDSLLLDLFHMPIVEPYAISEPLSTAGKVNMNYGIAPFNWIQRSTAVRAALQSTRVTAIPFSQRLLYKGTPGANINYRLQVDRDETLKASDALFAEFPANLNGGFYKSATQICDRFLYPKTLADGTTATVPKWAAGEAAIRTFWYGTGVGTGLTDAVRGHSITGDNLREKPYGDLYPRLTTKSNTYTVHMRVQTLRKKPGSNHAVWDEVSDQVTSEYRGSSTIERYIDPHDPRFDGNHPDYIDVDKQSLEPAYRFRVVNSKRFQPY